MASKGSTMALVGLVIVLLIVVAGLSYIAFAPKPPPPAGIKYVSVSDAQITSVTIYFAEGDCHVKVKVKNVSNGDQQFRLLVAADGQVAGDSVTFVAKSLGAGKEAEGLVRFVGMKTLPATLSVTIEKF